MRKYLLNKFALTFFGLAILKKAFSNNIQLTRYRLLDEKITENFRMIFICDLHNNVFGDRQKNLIEVIDGQRPDIVLLGGDFFDNRGTVQPTVDLLTWLGRNYPTYFVTGNHELSFKRIKEIKELVTLLNIKVLNGDTVMIKQNKQQLNLHGVDDYRNKRKYRQQMKNIYKNIDSSFYNIFLSHRPERIHDYEKFPFDLILAGHAHGGQIRIPGVMDGLYAPHQGFFPELTSGKYQLTNGTTMIVSRGLGYQHYRFPRVFNQPEIVVIDLEK